MNTRAELDHPAWRLRGRSRVLSRLLSVLALSGAVSGACLTSSCNTAQGGVAPPADRIWYPSALMVDPEGPWLYVLSSNSDLTYNAGTVAVMDLVKAAADRAASARPAFPMCSSPTKFPTDDSPTCCRDTVDPSILNCDERRYVQPDRTLRLGSFGSAMVRGKYPDPDACPDCTGRLYLAVRADPSVTVLDIFRGSDGKPQLRCARSGAAGQLGQPVDTIPACDDSDKVTVNDSTWDDSSSPFYSLYRELPAEPYALALDDSRGLLYVAHLTGGAVSLIDTCVASFPQLVDVSTSILPAASQRGFTSVTVGPEDDPNTAGVLFASSRFTPQVATVRAVGIQSCAGSQQLTSRDAPLQATSRVISTGLGAGDVRGVIFSPDPPATRKAYVLQRSGTSRTGVPQGAQALVFVDVAPDDNGVPRDTPVAVVEVCKGATSMVAHSSSGDRADELLYVTCYESGIIDVIDPRTRAVLAVINAGRGPSTLAFDGEGFAYVATFGSNDVAVLDVRDGSPTRFRLIQRLGFPSASPRRT